MVDTGERLGIAHEPVRDIVTGLPEDPPDDIATVVEFKVREKTKAEQKTRGVIGVDDPESLLA